MTDVESKLFGIGKLNVNRSDLPAITHVDYAARVQTVHGYGDGRVALWKLPVAQKATRRSVAGRLHERFRVGLASRYRRRANQIRY